ncbi:MAG TPA: phage holin family protein [Caldilineae bacterium]|nr:phage holin family protein [Caldilineae bacterium]
MNRLVIRLVINAAALWAATRIVPGIHADTSVETLVAVALIFGLVNTFLRPILKLLTCPLRMITLGLFTWVINALMLWLTSAIAGRLGLEFTVEGFMPALLGSLVVSAVSIVLAIFLRDRNGDKK